jgi:hypothetical protein
MGILNRAAQSCQLRMERRRLCLPMFAVYRPCRDWLFLWQVPPHLSDSSEAMPTENSAVNFKG